MAFACPRGEIINGPIPVHPPHVYLYLNKVDMCTSPDDAIVVAPGEFEGQGCANDNLTAPCPNGMERSELVDRTATFMQSKEKEPQIFFTLKAEEMVREKPDLLDTIRKVLERYIVPVAAGGGG